MSKAKQSRCCEVVEEFGDSKLNHPETGRSQRATVHAMPYHGGGVGPLIEFPDGTVIAMADYHVD